MSFSIRQIDPVIALYNKGQIREALDILDALIVRYPDAPELYNIAGTCYARLGKLKAAVKSYRRALQIRPDFATAHNNLGNVLRSAGQLKAATESYERALKIEPDFIEAHKNLGIIFRDTGQPEAAEKSFRKALNINPDDAETHKNLGSILMESGQMKAAIESYEQALKIKPDHAEAHRYLSKLKKYHKDDAQINLMENLLSSSEPNNPDRIHLCFALAKAYEDLGREEEMFKYLNEGNSLRKAQLNYSISQSKQLFSRIREIFDTQNPVIDLRKFNGAQKIQPIFIVGMMRSGTSLIEQILASHTEVHGAGELNYMQNIVNQVLQKHSIKTTEQHQSSLSEDDIKTIRHRYTEALLDLNVPEKIITDKLPQNFLLIGFILLAFPEAKIIHLNRDVRATCWSIYKNYFSGNGNGYAYDMNDLANYYHLYTELMEFWRQRFPNKIYDICYEDLTRNQEEETRKLLEYCQLNWEEQCLNFHKTKRTVKTVSITQVRKNMYQGSSEKWKKYEKYLQPLLKSLDR